MSAAPSKIPRIQARDICVTSPLSSLDVALAGNLPLRPSLSRMRLGFVKALSLEANRVYELFILVIRQLVRNRRNQPLHQRDSLGRRERIDRGDELTQPGVIHPLGFLARFHLPLREARVRTLA